MPTCKFEYTSRLDSAKYRIWRQSHQLRLRPEISNMAIISPTSISLCTLNSSKLQRLGSSLSRDFPCRFTHHNFANRLRDKINEAVYGNRILRGSPEVPSGDLVVTTLKLTTGREVTDGHSHFPTRSVLGFIEFGLACVI